MITTSLLIIIGGLLKAIFDLTLTESSGIPDEIAGYFETLWAYARGVNTFLPVEEALTIFRLSILLFFSYWFFKFGIWVYSKIPFIGK